MKLPSPGPAEARDGLRADVAGEAAVGAERLEDAGRASGVDGLLGPAEEHAVGRVEGGIVERTDLDVDGAVGAEAVRQKFVASQMDFFRAGRPARQ